MEPCIMSEPSPGPPQLDVLANPHTPRFPSVWHTAQAADVTARLEAKRLELKEVIAAARAKKNAGDMQA